MFSLFAVLFHLRHATFEALARVCAFVSFRLVLTTSLQYVSGSRCTRIATDISVDIRELRRRSECSESIDKSSLNQGRSTKSLLQCQHQERRRSIDGRGPVST